MGKDLLKWGRRIDQPEYDGDILVQPNPRGFSVVWQAGVLHISPLTKAVHWLPLSTMAPHCCRMSGNSLRLSAFRSRSIANG